MMNFYMKLDTDKKVFFWLSILAGVIYLALMPFYFFGLDKGYQYPNGWLLGSCVELFAYFTLLKITNYLTKDPSNKNPGLVILSSFLRPVLYILVLALGGVCTFKPEWLGGFDAFSFWTIVASIVPMSAVVLLVHFLTNKNGFSSGGNK